METKHDWLRQVIAQGFMLLASLNLKGRPAAADLKAVAQVWYGILIKRPWQPEKDVARVKAAFETIAATQTEWPNPVDLIKYLPAPEVKMVQPKLEKKHTRTEYGSKQLAEMRKFLADNLSKAPCMDKTWMNPMQSRSVDECKRIYAEKQKAKEE